MDVFKNFAKFTAKHQCWSFFFKKLKASGLQLCSKETPAQVFSCELCEIFQHTFLQHTPDNCFCQPRSSIFEPTIILPNAPFWSNKLLIDVMV